MIFIMQLQNDVCVLQHRPTIPIVAQPPAPIPIRNHTVSMLHLCQRRPHVPDLIRMRLHPSPERSLGLVMVVVINAGGVPAKTLLSLSTASITPAQVGSPKGSSDSSSDTSGRGGGGPGPPQGPPVCGGPLSPHAHAMSVGVG